MKVSPKIVYIVLALVFVGVIGGAAIMSGQYFDDSTVQQDFSTLQKEPQTFNENKKVAISLTEKAIDEYVFTGTLHSLDASFLTEKFYNGNSRYAFVIDYDDLTVLAHPNSKVIGQYTFDEINSLESPQVIKTALRNEESTWMHYYFTNPDTVQTQYKISYLKLHDGKIFGSGFYTVLSDEPATKTVNKQMAQFLTEHAIKTFRNAGTLDVLEDNLVMKFADDASRYTFVIDYDDQTILVHPNSDRVGTKSFALNNSEEPLDKILHTLKTTGSMWVHYDLINPDDGKIEPKMSFLKLADGYIFGSGFYIPDIIPIDDQDEDDYENDSDDNLKEDYKDEHKYPK